MSSAYWLAHREEQDGAETDFSATDRSFQHRLVSVKHAAAHEKVLLLDRVEQLSAALQELSREVATKNHELDQYHRVFGSLDDFATRQVALREEVVALRDSVRHWQEREHDARSQIRRMNRLVDSLRRGSRHVSTAERLSDLEDKIAAAQLQRATLLQQSRDLDQLDTARRMAASLTSDPPPASEWFVRGKRADLQRLLTQAETSLQTMEVAAESLRSVKDSSQWEDIDSINRKCPGCGEPQWCSPFCSQTGHQHLGFDKARGNPPPTAGTVATVSDAQSNASEPVWNPPNRDELVAEVEGALHRQEWIKLVRVGTYEVTFKNARTGKVVSDLASELLAAKESAYRQRLAEWKSSRKLIDEQQLQRDSSPRSAIAEHEATTIVRPTASTSETLNDQVKELVARLTQLTQENNKLRGLFSRAAKTGVVGWHPQNSTAGSNATSMPSQPMEAPSDREANAFVSLHDEDDSAVQLQNRRLQDDNAALGNRCTELILELAGRDDRIRELQNLLMRQHAAADSSLESSEIAMRRELGELRSLLITQERRCMSLEELLRRSQVPSA